VFDFLLRADLAREAEAPQLSMAGEIPSPSLALYVFSRLILLARLALTNALPLVRILLQPACSISNCCADVHRSIAMAAKLDVANRIADHRGYPQPICVELLMRWQDRQRSRDHRAVTVHAARRPITHAVFHRSREDAALMQ